MSKTPGSGKQKPISAFFKPITQTPTTPSTCKSEPRNSAGYNALARQLVGKRVQVFWPVDAAWYCGKVTSYDRETGKHQVHYDDDEEEELVLVKKKYEILEDQDTNMTPGVKVKSQQVIDEGYDAIVRQLVGQRVRVYWPLDMAWYCGAVISFDAETGEHRVRYNDGEMENVELVTKVYEILQDQQAHETPVQHHSRQQIIDGELDGESEQSASDAQDDGDEWKVDSEESDASQDSITNLDSSEDGFLGATPGGKRGNRRQKRTLEGGDSLPAHPAKCRKVQSTSEESSAAAANLQHNTADRNPKLAAAFKTKLDETCDGQISGNSSQEDIVVDTLSPDGFIHNSYDRFPWMRPSQIKDGNGRRPTQEGYDPSTIYIPDGFFKKNNVTEGQKQWWEFKAQNFDAVLMFKMGKFYELFEMDAHVGVDVLGIAYMKGNRPHCGFPEAAYHQYAEALARAGYKVVVIEQTETPEMLKVRNEELKKARKPTSKVVRREKVAVLTKGTLRDAEMVQSHPDPAYLMAIIEISPVFEVAVHGSKMLGICAVDVASNHILLGQFCDDDLMANLRTHVAALQPVELLLPIGDNFLSPAARKLLKTCPINPRCNNVPVGEKGFMTPALTTNCLEGYFSMNGTHSSKPQIPEALRNLVENPDANVAVLYALGAIIGFLKEGLMDDSVLPLAAFDRLDANEAMNDIDKEGPRRIILDSSALENLEIIQNSEGGTKGSLLSSLDECKTPFGRRMLRQWLSRPFGRVSEIRQRQNAIKDLTGAALECAGSSRKLLSGIGDLERALARLHTSTLSGASSGRDAAHVILYEDSAKRKVNALVTAIRGLESANEAIMEFKDVRSCLTSELLKSLITPGMMFPDLADALSEMSNATDWPTAKETGRIIPSKGIVPEYDAAQENVRAAERKLSKYLEGLQVKIGKQVSYVAVNKDSHLVEVPDSLLSRVPTDFELVAQKKNYKRYMTPELRPLVNDLDNAKAALEKEMSNILQELERKFASQHNLWARAVDATSQLDALMSLAASALSLEGTTCCPEFVETGEPVFSAKGLRHPCFVPTTSGGFVPNDVDLGVGGKAGLMLLTGPNMGGKSTLIRQVCLATILAQVGAFVPADSLLMSPVDAIFVRMGARDHILSSQSTFFVELSETAGMLRKSTKNSLVALDELGRGTATSDGAAIASAVLEHVTSTVQCRGLFATHYHDLAREHSLNPSVIIKHMGCRVTPPALTVDATRGATSLSRGIDEVTFLYKLIDGACPKSYGTNVARLAGLPPQVVEIAAELSEDMERRRRRDVDMCKDVTAKLLAWKASGMGNGGREWVLLADAVNKLKEIRGWK